MIFNEIITCLEIGLIYSIASIGIFLSFRILGLADLTCDGSFAVGSIVYATAVTSGFSPWISMALSAISGAIAGLLTAFLHQKCRINIILASILIAFASYSINLRISNNAPNISLLGETMVIGNHAGDTLQSVLLLASIVLTILLILIYLFKTDFGLAIRAVGLNPQLSQAMGIKIALSVSSCLAISNGLVSFSAAIAAQHQGFADISQGQGTLITALAAVILGERLRNNRSITIDMILCVIGSCIYRLLISAALHSDYLGFTTSDLNLITAILVIFIMITPYKNTADVRS